MNEFMAESFLGVPENVEADVKKGVYRGAFRILSKVYDGIFLRQSLMAKSHILKVVKELVHKVRLLKAVSYFHKSSPS